MQKILVSDLIGTLIPTDYMSMNYLYGDGTYDGLDHNLDRNDAAIAKNLDRAFKVLGTQLTPFFEDGNELNIVTSIDSHMSPSFLLEVLIRKLYQNVCAYHSQVHFYFQTQDPEKSIESLCHCADITENGNIIRATTPDNIALTFLSEKSDVFDFLSSSGSAFHTIGDTHNDIGMMMRSLTLGGRADFIKQNLNKSHKTFVDILSAALSREDTILVESTAIQRYPNFWLLNKDERDAIKEQIKKEIITNDYVYSERIKKYDAAFAGEVDINKEYVLNCIYEIIELYNDICGLPTSRREMIPLSTCYQIGMYPTFIDYYRRVLKK